MQYNSKPLRILVFKKSNSKTNGCMIESKSKYFILSNLLSIKSLKSLNFIKKILVCIFFNYCFKYFIMGISKTKLDIYIKFKNVIYIVFFSIFLKRNKKKLIFVLICQNLFFKNMIENLNKIYFNIVL